MRLGFRRRLWSRGCRSGRGLFRFFLLARLHRRGALLEAEAVRFADNGVAAYSAQFVGDLARGCAIVPHLFQALDALVGPGHLLNFAPTLLARSPADRRLSRERPASQLGA